MPKDRNQYFSLLTTGLIAIDIFSSEDIIVLLCSLVGIAIPYFNRNVFKEFRHRGIASRIMLICVTIITGILEIINTSVIDSTRLPAKFEDYIHAILNGVLWLAVGVLLDIDDEKGNKINGGVSAKIKDLVDKVKAVHGTKPPVRIQPTR